MPVVIEVSRADGRPLHRQIADTIRAAIASGELRPDEPLPSESDLAEHIGVGKNTVRSAINLLTHDGLLVKRAGFATRVAVPAPVRHMATDRYANELAILRDLEPGQPHPATSAFTQDHDADWTEFSVQADYAEDTAGPDDARYLEVPVGAAILRRRLLKMVRGLPMQLQDSVMPLASVKGTPVADPARQPWPGGTIAELWSVGLRVVAVVEEAQARTPTVAERTSLDMTTAGPVFDILRIFHAVRADNPQGDPFPVEVSRCVVPAAGVILRWETDLPRD